MTDKYFKILELNSNATLDEVEAAYKSLVTVWHPDRFQQNKDLRKQAEEKAKILNEAYSELKANFKADKYFANKKNSTYHASSGGGQAKEGQAGSQEERQANNRAGRRGKGRSQDSYTESAPQKANKYKLEKKDSKLKYFSLILFSMLLSFSFYKIYLDKKDVDRKERAVIEVDGDKQILERMPNGSYKVVKIESNTKNTSKSGEAGRSELLQSALSCNKAKVSELLSRGEEINQIDVDGNTALAWAVKRGCEDLVKFLISKNANVNLKSSNGFTPLMWASLYKREGIKKILLNEGSSSLPQYWNRRHSSQ